MKLQYDKSDFPAPTSQSQTQLSHNLYIEKISHEVNILRECHHCHAIKPQSEFTQPN